MSKALDLNQKDASLVGGLSELNICEKEEEGGVFPELGQNKKPKRI